mmetsp:Transcript_95476/g.165857  ORF Transcript_95476/g.165857 Transcript_95476/m.165857 type:complete len:215 (-) Transcript_95476:48-692(-)
MSLSRRSAPRPKASILPEDLVLPPPPFIPSKDVLNKFLSQNASSGRKSVSLMLGADAGGTGGGRRTLSRRSASEGALGQDSRHETGSCGSRSRGATSRAATSRSRTSAASRLITAADSMWGEIAPISRYDHVSGLLQHPLPSKGRSADYVTKQPVKPGFIVAPQSSVYNTYGFGKDYQAACRGIKESETWQGFQRNSNTAHNEQVVMMGHIMRK